MNRSFVWVPLTLLAAIAMLNTLCPPALCAAEKSAAAAYTPANAQAGQDVFLQKCFQCHSINKGEVRVGPSLYGVMKNGHLSAVQVHAQLVNGKGKMPPFKDLLTPEEMDHVIAYLHSL
jgi:mono/diheme cytochrome c family protein